MEQHTDLSSRSRKVLWHPCSQMKDYESELPLIPIKKGQGVWLYDTEGNRYLDAISSWWVNLFGHAHPKINQAIKAQADNLEHVIFAGLTHEPGVRLAERLVALAPGHLDRCFYADNGSSAVEAALKMSFQYWQNMGQGQKRKFMTLSNSYHGETLGALSVGDVGLYKEVFSPLLLDVITVPSPDCYDRAPGQSLEDFSRAQFAHMKTALEQNAHEVCAVIVEPLIQGAGGMRMYHPVYLQRLREVCDEVGVHLIADEIMTSFGRTGTMFACEQAGIAPDFMCLSKGLTGGYLPLSVVMTHDEIYQAFYDDYQNLTAFLHSHSYTGNPLACAAAHASLDIFEADNIIQANQVKANKLAELIAPFADHPHIGDVRQTGMVAAIEMVQDKKTKTPYDWRERRGLTVYRHGLNNEMLLRPLGNVVYFMPPYVITEDEMTRMVEVAAEGIELAVR